MEITKQSVGQKVYFIDKRIGNNIFIIEYGEITGVVPKYNFHDKFLHSYNREENILIKVKDKNGEFQSKVLNNHDLAFTNIEDVLKYCEQTEVFFGLSVVQRGIK